MCRMIGFSNGTFHFIRNAYVLIIFAQMIIVEKLSDVVRYMILFLVSYKNDRLDILSIAHDVSLLACYRRLVEESLFFLYPSEKQSIPAFFGISRIKPRPYTIPNNVPSIPSSHY